MKGVYFKRLIVHDTSCRVMFTPLIHIRNVSRTETAMCSIRGLLEQNNLSVRIPFLDEGKHFLFGICIEPAMFGKTVTVLFVKCVYLGLDFLSSSL